LMFMGFAGTAAAQDVDIGLDASGGDGGDGGDAVNFAEVNQQNSNSQVAAAEASVSNGAADHDKKDKKHDKKDKKHNGNGAFASAGVSQTQFVNQQNFADVDQTAFAGDGGDGGDAGNVSDVDIQIDIDT
ncbi:hypothetical protein CV102_24750, partial [Natronococcus pandeyae]